METFHGDLTRPTTLLIADGRIITFADYSFVVFCRMDLEYFPMDVQSCDLGFLSYLITKTRLIFAKNKYSTHRETKSSDMTYDLIYTKVTDEKVLGKDVASRLKLNFVFKRRLHLYLMTTYFPSLLVTVVSFTSFWIHPDAVPGRITLGVTCLLALMTQMVSVRSAIMNMNYVTSIDIWFLACITFVAMSLFEFSLSYTLSRNQRITYMRVNIKNPTKMKRIRWKLLKLSADQWSRCLFPVLLICFIVTYFLILISLSNNRRNLFIH